MRLVSLSVRNFQCIESAELEFGPGLNVLFGPNDLGKSSLAWAIRAVLLLQYNSAEHERFVSWYGGSEPSVTLTLCDDEERAWRVHKCFSRGAAGRASLESSANGRDFRSEASARQTDDKLRELLRWGIQRPGGRGAPRGLPQSFLTQVLLSDQDDVRAILFDASLETDGDEGGRARLTAALGALAQDPLFKRVLDQAQAWTDRAFTANGRRKTSAGSPFRAAAARVKELDQEKRDLEERVRESQAAEERVKRLVAERDELDDRLARRREALAIAERELEVRRARDGVAIRLDERLAILASGESLEQRVAEKRTAIEEIETDLEAAAARMNDAREDLAGAEETAVRARRHLDELGRDDAPALREKRSLAEDEKAAVEAVHAASREVERAETLERAATAIARELTEAAERAAAAEGILGAATARADDARADVARARAARDAAREQLRELTSDDRAREEALRRQELENRRLLLSGQIAEEARAVERARTAGEIAEKAQAARTAHASQAALVQAAAARLEALAASRKRFEEEAADLEALARRAELQALQENAREAARSAESAAELRRAADANRVDANALRDNASAAVPSADEIEAIRRLREELRVGEARLGAVSVTLRPRRPLTVELTRDGVAEPGRVIREEVALAAEHDLVIGIDDLLEIEIAGGDEPARRAAAELRARWQRDGEPVLRATGAASVEALGSLRQRVDDAERAALEKEREAERALERADQLDEVRPEVARERIAALETELAGLDGRALDARLAGLGSDPWRSLRERRAGLGAELRSCLAALEREREQHAREDATLAALEREAALLEREARSLQVELGEPWPDLVARHEAAAGKLREELATIDRELAARSGKVPEEAAAREALSRCEAAAAEAEAVAAAAAREEIEGREALAAANARLSAVRDRARELDSAGLWAPQIERGATRLPLDGWLSALDSARRRMEEKDRRLAEIRTRAADVERERARTLEATRAAVTLAEAAVRSARANLESLQNQEREDRDEVARLRAELAAAEIELARTNLAAFREEVARLRAELDAFGEVPAIDEAGVAAQRDALSRLAGDLDLKKEELAGARGALEHVGGAVVRERIAELERALEHASREWQAIETDYEGWKLLVETLRAAESAESAHLGRALAAPVSQRFRQLTGDRYDGLELGAHLEAEGLRAAGDLREIAALSAGTQDQLATLLRLCVAEHLRSSIVLDDHLSQSDPARVAWFKDVLLDSCQKVQILLITCRPHEILRPDELPDGAATRASAAGLIRAVDLARVIHRFASGPPAATAGRHA